MLKRILYFAAICLAILTFASCEMMKGDPDLNITSGVQAAVKAEDSVAVFHYEIVNGTEDGEIVVNIDGVDWITRYEVEEYEVSGRILLYLTENKSLENRSAIISVSYRYGGTSIDEVVNVIQQTRQYDYDYVAELAVCNYWGLDSLETGLYAYDIYLGQGDLTMETQGEAYYALEFLTAEDSGNFLPKAGVYTVAYPGEEVDMSISAIYSLFMNVGDAAEDEDYDVLAYFAEGEVTVDYEGNEIIVAGYLTDRRNYNHRVYYKGEIKTRNRTVISTLTGDVNLDLTGYILQANYFGDAFENGTSVWTMSLGQEGLPSGTSVIQMQLSTEKSVNMETGFATQTFVYDVNNTTAAGTFFKGYQTEMYSGSWLYTSAGLVEGVLYVQDPAAPFRGGEVHFERNADGTLNIDVDVLDDAKYSIKASGKNIKVEYFDMTAFASSVQSMAVCK